MESSSLFISNFHSVLINKGIQFSKLVSILDFLTQ